MGLLKFPEAGVASPSPPPKTSSPNPQMHHQQWQVSGHFELQGAVGRGRRGGFGFHGGS